MTVKTDVNTELFEHFSASRILVKPSFSIQIQNSPNNFRFLSEKLFLVSWQNFSRFLSKSEEEGKGVGKLICFKHCFCCCCCCCCWRCCLFAPGLFLSLTTKQPPNKDNAIFSKLNATGSHLRIFRAPTQDLIHFIMFLSDWKVFR